MPDTKPVADPAARPRQPRKNNPEKTRQDILLAAIREFAEQGLSGARVDAIAERTSTSKRMIYYYFGSKEQLYLAVLEKLYGDIRATEATLRLDELEPEAAIRRLVEFTFDHHAANVDFIRLVSIENIHHGEHIARSPSIRSLSKSIVSQIAAILARGADAGVFRAGIDPLDLHLLISSFCFFRVSNRYTFSTIHQIDLGGAEARARHREMICEAVIRHVRA
ncbi:TetR-family transcriptional regulatory protein [Azotobacter vinelandii CA]|uniref:TetR-family transcriptional regulatory protein n=2 Tax=Azotobacter vinelandii TaxID=354 RepID=C1DS76_AZOVD|nr:TetR/AcrR family transcriptional regulator [Azotobacter vinelandii]ACO79951.1 TetR-family transcriptional regulatory protein [Azotobacter vinelandii DJ]AGK13874.1 TetR-family transcriptional regulatory protein [Azotobacter vinelandii CA]AGK18530.1 TetR-family transcriptional regulatory protein [Azotobacter vinelandii CA6]WKN20697.1 TetR family transcriptional regulator [Azotobacter vinelandii]SFX45933.1 transcriptional regulator, TetR family [Azotobacter vinelandii]